MPVIKSAIKKLRRDKKREKINDAFRKKLEKSVKDANKKKTASSVTAAVSLIDRAVKNNIIHKNRAARLKSSLSKHARPEQGRRAGTETKREAKLKQGAKKTPVKTTAKKSLAAKKQATK
jgi:small subunit ribosomal protein S20